MNARFLPSPRLMSAAGVLFLLSACAPTPERQDALMEPEPLHIYVPVPHYPDNGLEQTLRALSTLSDTALQDEAHRLDETSGQPLRHALVLLMLGGVQHEAQARRLLAEVSTQSATNNAEALLAQLMLTQLQQGYQLRQRLRTAERRHDAVQQQLEELKAIEQQIRDRPVSPELELEQ